MNRIIFLLPLIIFVYSSSLASEDWSDKPIIDEEFRTYEKEIDKVTNECMEKEKNPIKQMKCGDELLKKYRKEGKIRGTKEYCKKHYGNFGFDNLHSVWKNLKSQRRKARINPNEKISGEVTEGMFMVEEFWVESRLAKLQKERTVKTEKKVYQKSE